MQNVSDIRQSFLSYFQKHDHKAVHSSSLVPHNDPSLMFTNAGMVPFKNVFTGLEKPVHPRAVSSQKCVRAGGKHNDLDNVGYTARHHTFFEMLGNFSFGDYFKEEAIFHAWTLITQEFGLNPDKLLVTIYHDDEDAYAFWKKIAGLRDDRIIRIATTDNFWSMGATGPCGPCSEIFYDHGEGIQGGPPGSKDEDGDRFIEIWNLVFMQYEQIDADTRISLPKPSIDTGMGLERISAVLQNVHNNYDIDLFKKLIEAGEDVLGVLSSSQNISSHRVIVDHLRSMCFLIADGVLPSNEGRGYVLRRIMRRAMRHATILGAQEPVLFKLVSALIIEMGAAYGELHRARHLITDTIELEEKRFMKTLSKGLSLLDHAVNDLGAAKVLNGEIAFKLYDTYGFPLDLTKDALRQKGLSVDVQGFNAAMMQQKQEARASWVGSGDVGEDKIWFELQDTLQPTEFLGYERLDSAAQIEALIKDKTQSSLLSEGDQGVIVLNQSVFYAESGGQIADKGSIISGDNIFIVENVSKRQSGFFAHEGFVKSGHFESKQEVSLSVQAERRFKIAAHHSATHILHEALRFVLGDHVVQKGSLVSQDRLRFDIAHPKPISELELKKVSTLANGIILQNSAVKTRLMPVDDAIASGARALFGEKYGDEVRVVSMGHTPGDRAYSVELCGGTHVQRTGDIGLIHILGDSGVSAGVRRIEALAGQAALSYLEGQAEQVRTIAQLVKTKPDMLTERVTMLLKERKKMENELIQLRRKVALSAKSTSQEAQDPFEEIGDIQFYAKIFDDLSPRDLKPMADELTQKIEKGVLFLASERDGKAAIVIKVTDNLTERFNAVDLVRLASKQVGGKGGGGRPDMAQAGGPNGDSLQDALEVVRQSLLK